MGNGFQFIDIIFFALIAAFLVLRLRNVLGRRDGHEGGYPDRFADDGESRQEREGDGPSEQSDFDGPDDSDDNVISLPDQNGGPANDDRSPDAADGEPVSADTNAATPGTMEAGIAQIQQVDRSFKGSEFLSGARIAFELTLGAYAAGDSDTLRGLLSGEVYSNFAQAIRSREVEGQTMDETLVGIQEAELVEAYMDGEDAYVTVKFVSEQINAIRDEDGIVIEGDDEAVIDVTDFWTFARDTSSNNPNWILVATRSMD